MSATIPDKSRKRNGRKTRERDRKKSRERNRRILNERQRRILKRIENRPGPERDQPMMTATNIHYELAARVQGLSPGGIGAMHLLARRTGLIGDIDRNLHLFKRHLPDHESDHVLNIASKILAGGKRIEHLELRRNDEVDLNALGAVRILEEAGINFSAERAMEALQTVRLVTFRMDDRPERRGVSGGCPDARRVLKALKLTDLKPPTPPEGEETVM